MKRLGLVLLCIAILVLFLARGDEEKQDPEPAEPVKRPVPIPVPMPAPVDPIDAARGIYMLESGEARIALDLQKGRAFRSIAKFPGREARETSGTWSLAGRNLTLTYRAVGGEPIEPRLERCRYLGDRVEMKMPGRDAPVVLRKAAVIRHDGR